MLKPYIAYSDEHGRNDGAALVFAHTVKEAKEISFPVLIGLFVEEWVDLKVTWIREDTQVYAFAEEDCLDHDIPHVIDDPPYCRSCELWGERVNEVGLCLGCGQPSELPADLIVRMLSY